MATALGVLLVGPLLAGVILSLVSFGQDRARTREAWRKHQDESDSRWQRQRIAALEAECRIPIEEMVRRAERQAVLDYRREQFINGE